jgi:glutamine synthetase
MDPFYAQSTMAIFCDILDPMTGEGYSRDPRMTAKKAEAYVKSGGFGDTAYFGPEPEFFLFDDVRSAPIPTTPASRWTPSNCRQHPRRIRDRQPGPPSAHQGRLLPGQPGRLGAGYPLRNADRPWRKWA